MVYPPPKAEIDMTVGVLTEAKKAGQFRAFWKDFNESVNLMASGETVIQSMWFTRGKANCCEIQLSTCGRTGAASST